MQYKRLSALILLLGSLLYSSSWAGTIINGYCSQAGYHCITAQKGQSWRSLFPDETERSIVMRLNRMNTELWAGKKIAVPDNLSQMTLLDASPLPRHMSSINHPTIVVQLSQLAWGAYDDDGNLVRWGPVSGGKGWCPDLHRGCHTATGTFTVYSKQGSGCKSTKFPIPRGGAPMPYCMFFHGGYALHGSPSVPGYNASHGCVRLFTDDARWLNQNFISVGSTRVIIKH